MRRLTGCTSNPFKPLTPRVRRGGRRSRKERRRRRSRDGKAEGAGERNMDSWRSLDWEKRVKSIKWYYWPLKLIGEVAVKGPWKAGMHDAALAAHTERCFPFMLHWARSRRRAGGEGGPFPVLMAPMTLMTAALIPDLMTLLVLGVGGVKLNL